jgi:hypothetical protein
MSDLVWYASYGSNLMRDRFLTYIQGGLAPGASVPQVGCTDPTLPRAERRILLLHDLYFAHVSGQWEDKGVAFIRRRPGESAKTLGRMYLVGRDQFGEVFLQENGHRTLDGSLDLDFEAAQRAGSLLVSDNLYGTLLHLGDEGGFPIFTFTASWDEALAPINAPGPKYLFTIIRGLQESYPLSPEAIVDYLAPLTGIKDRIPDQALEAVVKQATAT